MERLTDPDAQTALIPLPRTVEGRPPKKIRLKVTKAPDPSLPHFASSSSPNYISPKKERAEIFDNEEPKMYGKLLAILMVVPIFFLSSAVPMKGMLSAAFIYFCFNLYGYILSAQESWRKSGKKSLGRIRTAFNSIWWGVKMLAYAIPMMLIWFAGLIILNLVLSPSSSSITASLFGLKWASMKFTNSSPHSLDGFALGLWSLFYWSLLVFKFGAKYAKLGYDCAYRSIYRGVKRLKDGEGSGLINKDAYLHPHSARCGIALLILLSAFTLASITVYLALGAINWGPVFVTRF